MNLREAYRILDVPVGSNEEAVREARKTLAKVWHPDRHANDPELQARAHTKLAEINAAFELVSDAGFPSKLPDQKPARAERPKAQPDPPKPPTSAPPDPPRPPRSAQPDPPKPPPSAPPKPSPTQAPKIEFVPRRRVRWPVVVVLAAALGVGAYFAIVRLGRNAATPPAPSDATTIALAPTDAAETVEIDAAVAVDDIPEVDAATVVDSAPVVANHDSRPDGDHDKTFTLGSSHDEVIAAQGDPQADSQQSTGVNGVQRSKEQMTYGTFSTVKLVDGKVVEWWTRDVALFVRMDPVDRAIAATAKARGTIKIGSARDEVIGVLGAPTQVSREPTSRWSYGFSFVEFDGAGNVSKIWQGDRKIPVSP